MIGLKALRIVGRFVDLVVAKPEQAADGLEAGRKISDLKPSLIVLDLLLPGVDGLKVCRDLRRDPRLKETRVLAVTSHGEISRVKVVEAGADALLMKPFHPKDFQDVVKLLLGPVREEAAVAP